MHPKSDMPCLAGSPSEEVLLTHWGGLLPPWIAYRTVIALATVLDRLRDAIVPPQLRMVEHSMAFARTQVMNRYCYMRHGRLHF